jgi:hypothetical protein
MVRRRRCQACVAIKRRHTGCCEQARLLRLKRELEVLSREPPEGELARVYQLVCAPSPPPFAMLLWASARCHSTTDCAGLCVICSRVHGVIEVLCGDS